MNEIWFMVAVVVAIMFASYLVISVIFALALAAMLGSFTGGRKD